MRGADGPGTELVGADRLGRVLAPTGALAAVALAASAATATVALITTPVITTPVVPSAIVTTPILTAAAFAAVGTRGRSRSLAVLT